MLCNSSQVCQWSPASAGLCGFMLALRGVRRDIRKDHQTGTPRQCIPALAGDRGKVSR